MVKSGMDFTAELAQFNPDPALAEWLATRFEQAHKKVATLHAEVRNKDLKIQALSLELAYHKRLKFCSKAEAFSSQQRDLFIESEASDYAAIEAELEQVAPAVPKAKAKPAGRQTLPAELPRILHRHEPESCHCGQCGKTLVNIGEDVSEQLDVEPARFFVHRPVAL